MNKKNQNYDEFIEKIQAKEDYRRLLYPPHLCMKQY